MAADSDMIGQNLSKFLETFHFSPPEYAQHYAVCLKKIGAGSPIDLQLISTKTEFDEVMKRINIDPARYFDKLKLKQAVEKVKKLNETTRTTRRVSFASNCKAQYVDDEQRRIFEKADKWKKEIKEKYQAQIKLVKQRTNKELKELAIKRQQSNNKHAKYPLSPSLLSNSSYSSTDGSINHSDEYNQNESEFAPNPTTLKVRKRSKSTTDITIRPQSKSMANYDGDKEKEATNQTRFVPRRRTNRRRKSLPISPVQTQPIVTQKKTKKAYKRRNEEDDSMNDSPFKRRKFMPAISEEFEANIDLTNDDSS